MEFYLLILIILIGLLIGLLVWVIRLFRLYKKGKKKSFAIQVSILTVLLVFITWELQIFPLSKNFHIKGRTTELTGKKFWSWEEFNYEDISVRGEGYSLDIYKFNEETADYFRNPSHEFFDIYPKNELADIKWTKTPVKEDEQRILEFVTPNYGGWEGEIVEQQKIIRTIANQPGAYYSYQDEWSTNFYLIVPEKQLVILINHNM
ncbi:hypothetical protein [Aureitalea marina]|uniref:Uncharacterized protein n=1 Tax=Aureitalea marina TaxID=930804 RepID=A0A2S7KT65_9FLAO|nr:hypothetical protein [Aureitalea marina]PQB05778.1 hypothetical protein BST85_13400 [Aureitalea marina]